MRHIIIIALIVTICSGALFAPRARAIDPVTIAILAPIAIKGAQIAAPYVIRGLISGGKGMLEMGKDVLNVLRLPWGILQSTLLAPFGGFSSGVNNIVKGGIAPFQLIWDTILLPIRFCGVGV